MAGLELSIRDARTRFTEAAAAAAAGERVVVTKHGRPFIEMVPARSQGGIDLARLAEIREELGWTGAVVDLPDDFDDSAFSRRVLGLDP